MGQVPYHKGSERRLGRTAFKGRNQSESSNKTLQDT
jgi:hypothetical protein